MRLDYVLKNTHDIAFIVACYLELSDAIIIYYIPHVFANKCQIACFDILENCHLYLVNNHFNSKKI